MLPYNAPTLSLGRKLRAVACLELGLRCNFVAYGRSPREARHVYWVHARAAHGRQLAARSAEEKARLSDLVDALSHSERRPRHQRPPTSPGLRELEATGVVRRWWC